MIQVILQLFKDKYNHGGNSQLVLSFYLCSHFMERLNYRAFSEWDLSFTRPLIISGPCGVESEEQIHEIAAELARLNVHMLRGGIWKPRTRPDSFQGIGSEGLTWLKKAGSAHNMPVTAEVATPRHVEEALEAGIDVLWIGARTTVNPFLVQEIADALTGVNVPVMIKNPINPELELWIEIGRAHV